MATSASDISTWTISGDYFENCNCDVMCPCLFSPQPPMTSTPTRGACEVPFAFHIESGRYGDVPLDGLNAVVVLRTPGVMAEGNATVALYLDERADDAQREALTAIFSGTAGGPMGTLAPLVGEVLGARSAPITFRKEHRHRSVEIPNVLQLAVTAAPNIDPDHEMAVDNAHPLFPTGLVVAVGDAGSVYEDYGMRWDNSGRNGHYAAFSWSNA